MSEIIKSQDELKRLFAAALLKFPDEPFRAAQSCLPDIGTAAQASMHWLNDPIVTAEKMRLLESSDAVKFLPTKDEQAREIWRIAIDSKVEDETRLKAHRLYAEVMNHIDKSNGSIAVNLQTNVMVVPVRGSDRDWESDAIVQQRALISHAAN